MEEHWTIEGSSLSAYDHAFVCVRIIEIFLSNVRLISAPYIHGLSYRIFKYSQ